MKKRKIKKKKVVVAMSGGVDSSVAAALLKQQDYDLIGVFMKFWSEPRSGSALIHVDSDVDLRRYENRCCSSEAEKRARKVAEILKIPFYVFNFEREFKKKVVDYFLKEYKEGRTPNPCVVCNKEIKFGLLLEKALSLNADYIATGHYARIESGKWKVESGRWKVGSRKLEQLPSAYYSLLRGKDKNKDQSYFLWQINQRQLKRILFPVGDYVKDKVKTLAKKFNLPVLDIPESQEICFIQTTVNDFLERHLKTKPGLIMTAESPEGKQASYGAGKKIGQHQGLPFYTIGQRKGIELSGGPFYVAGKDLEKNNLIVTPFFNDKILYSKNLIAKNVNWILGKESSLPLKIKAQIRYGHKAVPAIITKKLKSKTYTLKFNRPQRAVTPGQSVVFYLKDELLGGGIIC